MRSPIYFLAAMATFALTSTAMTAQDVVKNINTLTAKSQALQAPATSINIVNGPLIVVGQGPFPQIIAGFTDIVSSTTTYISQMQGMSPFTAQSDIDAVANAFREFVRVHQALLNILIGKAGLFNTVPFIGQPVAAVLRQLEGVVDTVAFGLIDALQSASQSAANGVTSELGSLDTTIQLAIQSYDGLSLSKLRMRSEGAVAMPVSRVKRGVVVVA